MKPWLTEICERVRTTSLVGENDEHWMQAAHALRDAEAVAYCGRCTELLACLIERCEQLQQALDHKPGSWQMLSIGDTCDCTLCKQSRELARLRRLEAALPKTADGVTIVPGMEVWANIGDIEPWHCGVVSIHVSEEYDLTVRDGDGEEDEANTDDCYSSREAAKKARKA